MRRLDYRLQRARIKRAVRHIRAESLVLDVGCHQGELAHSLTSKDCRYFGIDPDVAKPTADMVRGRFPDGLPAEWKSLDFDHVVALAVLEHVALDQLTGFLQSARTLLRPGGTVIATIPSPATDRLLTILRGLRLIHGMDLEAHDGLTLRQLIDAAGQAGLRLDRHQRFQLGLNNLLIWTRL